MAKPIKSPNTPLERVAPRLGGWPRLRVGVVALAVLAVVIYFAYGGQRPFTETFAVDAVFSDVNDIKRGSPVRTAGVNVGTVTAIEPIGDGSNLIRLSMKIDDAGLSVHEDARVTVRSRIFLEGNYFVDLEPGTPSAPELASGATLPVNQTASPVQFGELLTALQSDTRDDLRSFLAEFSKGLDRGGAEGFNEAIRHWEEAYRNTAIVNEATLGRRPHDLRGVIAAQQKIFGALSRDERSLRDLVVNLNRTAGAFAREDDALRATIPALRDVLTTGRPALQSLNRGLPSLGDFADAALPAARSSRPALDEQIPFTRQARLLVGRNELGALAPRLRKTVPRLAHLNLQQTRTLEQTRAFASCQNNVLLPFSKTPIPHPYFEKLDGEPFFEQSPRSFVGLSGESRLSDANTPYFRVQAGGGPASLVSPGVLGDDVFAQLDFPLQGIVPLRPDRQPSFRPDVPCETQEPPNLEPVAGGPELAGRMVRPQARGAGPDVDRLTEQLDGLDRYMRGRSELDPLLSELGGER
ncbi:MAG: MCE family protein [Thermoleophilaceae bacterium]|nr:MCE family protein [Thermoleophilaceae bacterium]